MHGPLRRATPKFWSEGNPHRTSSPSKIPTEDVTDVELVDVEELVVLDVLELETDVEVVVEVEVRLLVDDELDDERVVLPVEFNRPTLSEML